MYTRVVSWLCIFTKPAPVDGADSHRRSAGQQRHHHVQTLNWKEKKLSTGGDEKSIIQVQVLIECFPLDAIEHLRPAHLFITSSQRILKH